MTNDVTQLQGLNEADLDQVVGGLEVKTGSSGTNQDSSTSVGGGIVFDRKFKQRTDDAYRTDAIRKACEEKNTGFWGVDRKAAADCVLQRMNGK
jgi:hypothetical protein